MLELPIHAPTLRRSPYIELSGGPHIERTPSGGAVQCTVFFEKVRKNKTVGGTRPASLHRHAVPPAQYYENPSRNNAPPSRLASSHGHGYVHPTLAQESQHLPAMPRAPVGEQAVPGPAGPCRQGTVSHAQVQLVGRAEHCAGLHGAVREGAVAAGGQGHGGRMCAWPWRPAVSTRWPSLFLRAVSLTRGTNLI
jgi:hypothetical protein